MFAIPLALALLFGAPLQSAAPQRTELTPEQLEQLREKRESSRQAAIHINQLAGDMHSEADARAFVDTVAERLSGKDLMSWTTWGFRHRVARAEYQAVSDPSRLIPEQRIVELWNQYVRELDAPGETLISVAELHNLRDAMYTGARYLWKREDVPQSMWTAPDIYAVGADGKVASGCRAIEALKIFQDMFNTFQLVQGARERVRKGIFVSDEFKRREQDLRPPLKSVQSSHLAISSKPNPVISAEYHYVQAHSERDYQRLLERLFAELFPDD